jgi:hypothetical protein
MVLDLRPFESSCSFSNPTTEENDRKISAANCSKDIAMFGQNQWAGLDPGGVQKVNGSAMG